MESKAGVPPAKHGHVSAFFMSTPPQSLFIACIFTSWAHRMRVYILDRLLHMPFCDGIVGLARDNSAHLFNEKTLGCARSLIQSFNRFIIQTANYPRSYIRQLSLWPEKTQPRYIMNACEIEGGRGFAFCECPPHQHCAADVP
jgi:hypothetical protein